VQADKFASFYYYFGKEINLLVVCLIHHAVSFTLVRSGQWQYCPAHRTTWESINSVSNVRHASFNLPVMRAKPFVGPLILGNRVEKDSGS